jgi:hypothetical protein
MDQAEIEAELGVGGSARDQARATRQGLVGSAKLRQHGDGALRGLEVRRVELAGPIESPERLV